MSILNWIYAHPFQFIGYWYAANGAWVAYMWLHNTAREYFNRPASDFAQ